MDALLLQDLCMWILDRLPPDHGVSSLGSALDPTNLLQVLSQVVPELPDEPSLSLLTDIQRESELHVDSLEALLTIYVNTCRRLGMRCLFPPHAHPVLEQGAGADSLTDLGAVLRNVNELRALLAARDASLSGSADVRVSRSDLEVLGTEAGAGGRANATGTSRKRPAPELEETVDPAMLTIPVSVGEADLVDGGEEYGDEEGEDGIGDHFAGHAVSLTYAEHVALYSGRLGPGITPPGRARLWRYLLIVEPCTVCPWVDGGAGPAAARRRIGEARKAFLMSRSRDDLTMLVHVQSLPGQGLALARRRLVKSLVRAGIPPRYRGHLWLRLSGAGDGEEQAAPLVGEVAHASGSLSLAALSSGVASNSVSCVLPVPIPVSSWAGAGSSLCPGGLLQAAAAAEVALPPKPTSKRKAEESIGPVWPPLDYHPGPEEGDHPSSPVQHVSHYDRLVLLNAGSLGREGLPSRLTSFLHGSNAPVIDAGTTCEDSPTRSIPLWIVSWALAQGYAPCTLASVRQIDADLRRTMPHLWPIEAGRVVTECGPGTDGEADFPSCTPTLRSVRYVYGARHSACKAGRCTGGRLCRTAMTEQFTISLVPTSPSPTADAPPGTVRAMTQPHAQVTVSSNALRRVLMAYASHVPGLAYCQGLNFVAAHALRWLGEADVFAFLTLLVARVLPAHSYTDLTGTARDQEVLKELMVCALPALVAHVARLSSGNEGHARRDSHMTRGKEKGGDMDVDLRPGLQALTTITLRWFMSMFCLPFHAALSDRVWDALCFEGPAENGGGKAAFRAALALLRLAAPRVVACKTFHEAMAAVEAAPEWAGKPRVFAALFDCWVWPPPGQVAQAVRGATGPSAQTQGYRAPGKLKPAPSPKSPDVGSRGPGMPLSGRSGKGGAGRRTERRPGFRDWGNGVSGTTVAWLLGGPPGSGSLSSVSAGGRFGRAGMADSALDDAAVAAFQDEDEDEEEEEDEEEDEEEVEVEGEGLVEGEEQIAKDETELEQGQASASGAAAHLTDPEGDREDRTGESAPLKPAEPLPGTAPGPGRAPAPLPAPVQSVDIWVHPGLVWREKCHISRRLIAARRWALAELAAAANERNAGPVLQGAAGKAASSFLLRISSSDGRVFPYTEDIGMDEDGGRNGEGGGSAGRDPALPTDGQPIVVQWQARTGDVPDPEAPEARLRLLSTWYPAVTPVAGGSKGGGGMQGHGPVYTPLAAYFPPLHEQKGRPGCTPLPSPSPSSSWAMEMHSGTALATGLGSEHDTLPIAIVLAGPMRGPGSGTRVRSMSGSSSHSGSGRFRPRCGSVLGEEGEGSTGLWRGDTPAAGVDTGAGSGSPGRSAGGGTARSQAGLRFGRQSGAGLPPPPVSRPLMAFLSRGGAPVTPPPSIHALKAGGCGLGGGYIEGIQSPNRAVAHLPSPCLTGAILCGVPVMEGYF